MTDRKVGKVRLYLREYLGPDGLHPYEKLPKDMQLALDSDNDVVVQDVAGFLMYHASVLANDYYPWASCTDGLYYQTAHDCVNGINGKTLDEIYPISGEAEA